MKKSYSIAEMREADERTIAGECGGDGLILMERAGNFLADVTEKAAVRLKAEKILFVCGGGNNGGDGFVAARILKNRSFRVAVACLAEKFSPSCAAVKSEYDGEIFSALPREGYPLVVDCVLGTGLSRAPEGNSAEAIKWICDRREGGAYVISADIPSGLGENGRAFSPCVTADETVTMGLYKNALFLQDGADAAGKVVLADIGISSERRGTELYEDRDIRRFFPKRKSNVHKGSFGSCAIFAGVNEYPGAPLLSAGACLRSGAGYTFLYAKPELYTPYIGKLPAVVLKKYEGLNGEILKADCIAVGMGAGNSEELYSFLKKLLPVYEKKLLLDADALNVLAEHGAELLKEAACEIVITPHLKEFSRLSGHTMDEVKENGLFLAQEFAKEYGVTVVLKSNRTVISDGTRTAINLTGSPCLAKGGSGDVLSGILAATWARGAGDGYESAVAACYLFGRCGELAAAEEGEYSPAADDLIGYIGKAILSLQ